MMASARHSAGQSVKREESTNIALPVALQWD